MDERKAPACCPADADQFPRTLALWHLAGCCGPLVLLLTIYAVLQTGTLTLLASGLSLLIAAAGVVGVIGIVLLLWRIRRWEKANETGEHDAKTL